MKNLKSKVAKINFSRIIISKKNRQLPVLKDLDYGTIELESSIH